MRIFGVLLPKSYVTILIPRPKVILGALYNNDEFSVCVGLKEIEHCFFQAENVPQLDF